MDRRKFLAAMGAGASAAFLPGRLFAETTNLGKDEIEKRVAELLARMTLDDKIQQMSGAILLNTLGQMTGYNKSHPTVTPDNRRLGIPGIRFVDGPRGINFQGSTCFPVHIARGASWDPELQKRVGEVMGYEAKAQGANYTGAVCINLVRHPSWGRSQETLGEDPLHLGVMGAGFALGLQKYIMACAKHLACNNVENSRQYVDVQIDERTLREIYLPHFKRCVDEGVASIMCAYNKLNGQYCSANRHLLQEIVKDDWKFQGFIISDFGAVHDGYGAANAGLDVEMPITRYWGPHLKKMVLDGRVSKERIDDAVTRILRQKFRFGLFEKQAKLDKSKIASPEHASVACEAERKSIVLLKNEKAALPLERDQVSSIAVLGPFADTPNIGDKGSSVVRPPYVVTPLAGLREKVGKNVQLRYDPGEKIDVAEKLAGQTDAAVVVVGCNWMDEGEAHDRLNLNLSASQEQLVKAVAAANKRTIVVVEAGGAVVMESWKDKVPAILMAWYPGMEGGNAIAEIILGLANPSGKLPLLFPKSENQLPEFNSRAKTSQYGYYHGYRWFDKQKLEPAFPFGFGLSYTKFQYSNLRLGK
jgi:beta-glucosidase